MNLSDHLVALDSRVLAVNFLYILDIKFKLLCLLGDVNFEVLQHIFSCFVLLSTV